MLVVFNGSIQEDHTVQLPPLCEGVLYGYGAFETLKFNQGQPCFFLEHWKRLERSCQELDIALNITLEATLENIRTLAHRLHLLNGTLRIALFKDQASSHSLIHLLPPRYSPADYTTGFKVGLSSTQVHSSNRLHSLKTSNYLRNLTELDKAKKTGHHETLFVNENNHLTEGCVSNLFFVHQGTLCTPSEDCGLLPGILREKVIEIAKSLKLKVSLGPFSPDCLRQSEEAFLTNSLMEIMPIHSFENTQFDLNNSSITRQIQQAFLEKFTD